jgi:hypothetical protein
MGIILSKTFRRAANSCVERNLHVREPSDNDVNIHIIVSAGGPGQGIVRHLGNPTLLNMVNDRNIPY